MSAKPDLPTLPFGVSGALRGAQAIYLHTGDAELAVMLDRVVR